MIFLSQKFDSEIKKVVLNDATFKGTGAHFEPTYINFFFGNNGTGKSTIAKALLSGKGVTYASGKTTSDYQTLVFNQDYIDKNMRSYHNLPGVFTVNEANADIQDQIDRKTEEKKNAEAAKASALEEAAKQKGLLENLQKEFCNDCWAKTKESRTKTFPLTQNGLKGDKKKFANEIMQHPPVDHDYEELKRTYGAVYSKTAKRYIRFNSISDVSCLDSLEGKDILSVVIVNAAETELAKFWKELGSSEWVQQGHAAFHGKTNGKCPYCGQDLPERFEEKLVESFDDRYQKNLIRLDSFLQVYRDEANAVFVPLDQKPLEIYPGIKDTKAYDDKLAALRGVIAGNIEKIREKIAEPSKVVTLDNTAPLLQELEDIIGGYNNLIGKNNALVEAGPKKQQECRDQVFELMAFKLKDVIESFNRREKEISDEIRKQQDLALKQDTALKQIRDDIHDLNSQTVETESAMNNINVMLKDAGFQGFQVCPHWENVRQPDGSFQQEVQTPVRNYAVVRIDEETGKKEVAENLSEGEKNFIAFLYFQQRVFGSSTANGDTREKIVVIDDPVSSMDSGTLFIVSSQIRKMIEICHNNVTHMGARESGNFIKQIFILTHNAYFHKEVTYAHASEYQCVSFYLIRKRDNHSSIQLCEAMDPDCPTDMMNVNPVKNSYAALWQTYKEVSSSTALKNTIRRILEYYFLQLCGYAGDDLRKIILEDHKYDLTHDSDGKGNSEPYEMAKALLCYITSDCSGFNDGLSYTDEFIDPQICRDTFEKIFRYMGQGQHYDMMMGVR